MAAPSVAGGAMDAGGGGAIEAFAAGDIEASSPLDGAIEVVSGEDAEAF